jgi:glycine/D-amino acid oxidase-like deaminating enzyme
VTIVGGGILGNAHALEAIGRGHEVVQLEREAEARGPSVRDFGLIWVSGRATDELAAALRARELWEKLGAEIPSVGFRPAGSLTLLCTGT